MSNVIQFLETLGTNQALSPADYAATVATLDIDSKQRQALLDRDHAALNELSEGRGEMCCMILTPDGESFP